MKPAPFDYVRPASLDEACAILAADDEARLIAGGQTLLPLMAMRLARPRLVVDIGRLTDLAFIRDEGASIALGAVTRQCAVERDRTIRDKAPLLAAIMPWIGHAATRARGTIGGSLANADPAAELALAAVTLGATISYRMRGRSGDIAAGDFFLGAMTTALPAAACLTCVRFPVWTQPRIGVGFHEVSARRSDFALASAAAQVALDADGLCQQLALGVGGVAETPLRLDAAGAMLVGRRFDEASCRDAIRAALADVEVLADLHATAEYRRRAAVTLALRALDDAFKAAADGGKHAG